ncbi:MAG: GNAT family N-acetyltransferase [Firmicutes bacterium]|nr:GNAT family N-acetyltransferase [Bacillota bacterium]
MIIKELEIKNQKALSDLIDEIEETLESGEYWLPINDISREHFFDKEWTRFYGAFEDGELIAAAGLFLNPHEFGESLSQLGDAAPLINMTAEIGRAMVKPAYRGKNILLDINRRITEEAARLNKAYLIATIHPNNMPSQRSFMRLGMKRMLTYKKSCGYIRDIYLMEI